MLSQMAMGDIEDLSARGIHLSPADIVRINALGMRVERAAQAAAVVAAPRIAYAGNVMLHEPTLASDQWCDDVEPFAENADVALTMRLFAAAHADIPGFFDGPDLRTADGIQRAIKAWSRRVRATRRELSAAYDYAVYGNNADDFEFPAGERKNLKSPSDERAEMISEAVACGLGMTLAELRAQTYSRLIRMLEIYYRSRGVSAPPDNCREQVEYQTTLDAIERAALENHANG